MSDFVVNFDLLGGLSLDEWWKEMNRMEEEEKEERRHADINERDTEKLEKSRNKAGTIKQTLWLVRYFQTWCDEKDLATGFKSIKKMELNQSLHQFYAL